MGRPTGAARGAKAAPVYGRLQQHERQDLGVAGFPRKAGTPVAGEGVSKGSSLVRMQRGGVSR